MTHNKSILYLNNSATSFPKPPEVADAVYRALATPPQMTGRGEEAGTADRVKAARFALGQFLGCSQPERLIFTSNSTDALNTAIHGFFDAAGEKKRIHAITTTNAHNSVLRPLRTLEKSGRAEVTIVPSDDAGRFDLDRIVAALTPETRLLAINHLSNVVGTIAPIAELGAVCREQDILFVVDASQSAGLLDIDVAAMHVDLLAITGHKYMFGPTGIGALYIGERAELAPRKQGGTGVKSDYPLQPEELPIRFEAGTVNYVGIVGLDAGRAYIESVGPAKARNRAVELRQRCEEGLRTSPGVIVYGPDTMENKGAVVSFRVAGHGVAEVDEILRNHFGIIVRSGLHCAPLCHERLGTAPDGALRASFSCLTPDEGSEALVWAVREIAST